MISVCIPSIRPKGLAITQACLAKQTFQNFELLTEIGLPHKGHDLNKAYNRMIKRAKGELIVSLQDYIRIPDDGLEKFWEAYKKNPNTFFTAPVGKVLKWEDDPKWDWRVEREEANWQEWEADWGACPLKALYEIGGFDEELDRCWSADNVNVGLRAHLQGYKFKCLKDNRAVALDHDKLQPHPFRDNYNPDFHNQRLAEFKGGKKINYLV